MKKNKKPKRRNKIAQDMLTNPKYRAKVIPNKKRKDKNNHKDVKM